MKTQSAACVSPLPEIALHLHAHTHTRTNKQMYQCKHSNKQTCVHGACVCAWQGVCARVRVCTCLFSLMPCIRWNWLSHARTHAQTSRHLSACMQSNMCALWAVRTHGVPWVRGKVRVRVHIHVRVCVYLPASHPRHLKAAVWQNLRKQAAMSVCFMRSSMYALGQCARMHA